MVTPAPDFTRISVGMTKKEVIDILGKPDNVSLSSGKEYLRYISGKGTVSRVCFSCKEYYVRLVNNKVESYGSSGDSNSLADLGDVSYAEENSRGASMVRGLQEAGSNFNENNRKPATNNNKRKCTTVKLFNGELETTCEDALY